MLDTNPRIKYCIEILMDVGYTSKSIGTQNVSLPQYTVYDTGVLYLYRETQNFWEPASVAFFRIKHNFYFYRARYTHDTWESLLNNTTSSLPFEIVDFEKQFLQEIRESKLKKLL
jgi:hypothetical protein